MINSVTGSLGLFVFNLTNVNFKKIIPKFQLYEFN